MFKIGERIQCERRDPNGELTIGNIYTVLYCRIENDTEFAIVEGLDSAFFCWRFKSAKEQRKEKLEKIQKCSKSEIG